MGEEMSDEIRRAFEELQSPNGTWLRAIERDASGQYILMQTNHAWKWWELAWQARDAELAAKDLRILRLEAALQIIANPKRPDGTWNRDREACRQLAVEALKHE